MAFIQTLVGGSETRFTLDLINNAKGLIYHNHAWHLSSADDVLGTCVILYRNNCRQQDCICVWNSVNPDAPSACEQKLPSLKDIHLGKGWKCQYFPWEIKWEITENAI